MIVFVLLISRHGKTRLNKYYKDFALKERMSIQKEVTLPSSEGEYNWFKCRSAAW